ncbi:TetR/AcrR family transcriptional regulator [Aurantiacibacter odishensis]|uniref:TetR/AcrR family transcriptional regulator n=1 Tax=Aurantiacibacter odishensis TaxID=1155476 RepID=UPI0013C46CD8|nr:TetR/AcrR family transcriptional regulator [Aurantiacibacter odishensis]
MNERRRPGRPRKTDTDTSEAIADAARLRFANRGFDATSLREIAADANIDVALIAYRFGGKTGLWKSIVSQAAKELQDALDAALAETQGASPKQRLHHAMKTFLGYLLSRPEVPRLLLRDITIDSERSQWLLDELSLPLHRYFVELAQAAAANCERKVEHLQFRVASFIYSASSTVARRERLTKLADGIADDSSFEAALEATLIEEALRCD